jgi:hypothetical protein|tara:strand:- start:2765 stop:3013 length:249 start_codon:yes stop_codon:yes gene_type:complete
MVVKKYLKNYFKIITCNILNHNYLLITFHNKRIGETLLELCSHVDKNNKSRKKQNLKSKNRKVTYTFAECQRWLQLNTVSVV